MPIILALVLILGIFIGNILKKNHTSEHFIIYPQADKLNDVLNYIVEEYVDLVSKNELVELAIPEILLKLDPHSVYIPAKELLSMEEPLQGSFEGIGIEFNIQNDTIIVVNTISGGPSELIGILPGDRIVKINDTLVAGINISNYEVQKKLKGKQGTKVKVSILRSSELSVAFATDILLNFVITRDKIPLYSVDVAYMVNDIVGYIKISKFSRTTYAEFIKAIKKLSASGGKTKGLKKLIVDLRGNGGGYMDAAIKIADEFLEDKKLIVYTEGKSRKKTVSYATEKGICHNLKLAVLIDEWSASASEIFAGAIQDNDRGTIIGRRSFGKGLVQQPTFFTDGSSLRLTIARYYTPSGRCIQKPYNNGAAHYYYDIDARFKHGEFETTDSIHFADSLKYTTKGGKVVYGGGGIMPDIFVPLDTTLFSDYLTQITNKGLIYQFAFQYADNNRNVLSKYAHYKELEQYLDKQNLLNQFFEFAHSPDDLSAKALAKAEALAKFGKNGIKRNAPKNLSLKRTEFILRTQLKAYIARNILNNEGFYPIYQNIDTTLKKAVEILSEQ